MKKEIMKDSSKRKSETSEKSETLSINKKRKKKSKLDASPESDDSQDEYDPEVEKDIQEVLDKQEFPTKKISTKKSKLKEDKEDDDTNEKKDVAKDAAVEYLNLWKDNRKEWKFKKVRQTWLLQNMYEKEKVSDYSLILMFILQQSILTPRKPKVLKT